MKRFTRRSFLAFLAILPGTVIANSRKLHQKPEPSAPDLPRQWQHLLGIIIGPYHSILEVGKTCRQLSLQHEYSMWSRRFTINLDEAVSTLDRRDLNDLRNNYQHRVKTDFEQGRTTIVNGYVLSQTEAEICCWVATMKSKLV